MRLPSINNHTTSKHLTWFWTFWLLTDFVVSLKSRRYVCSREASYGDDFLKLFVLCASMTQTNFPVEAMILSATYFGLHFYHFKRIDTTIMLFLSSLSSIIVPLTLSILFVFYYYWLCSTLICSTIVLLQVNFPRICFLWRVTMQHSHTLITWWRILSIDVVLRQGPIYF